MNMCNWVTIWSRFRFELAKVAENSLSAAHRLLDGHIPCLAVCDMWAVFFNVVAVIYRLDVRQVS